MNRCSSPDWRPPCRRWRSAPPRASSASGRRTERCQSAFWTVRRRQLLCRFALQPPPMVRKITDQIEISKRIQLCFRIYEQTYWMWTFNGTDSVGDAQQFNRIKYFRDRWGVERQAEMINMAVDINYRCSCRAQRDLGWPLGCTRYRRARSARWRVWCCATLACWPAASQCDPKVTRCHS